MSFTYHFKPSHKEIKRYYDDLAAYAAHEVTHEGATSAAFQNLLAATCKKADWHLVPQLATKIKGKTVRPDGTLRDSYNLHHGYWEAKDSSDKLDAEIRKKIALGYPLSNTIFEDTAAAVLFQNGVETEPRYDLTSPQDLCDLLNKFYSHIEPDIVGFEQAVAEFKERVPQLAEALNDKIKAAHKSNKKFQEAFETFFELCRVSLNPNISEAAVDEMLIQHLLTIRLFDTIFDNPDFVRRNVIAAEVEKVIDALASKAFSREQFLKSLDRFYVAIESAARVLGEDFTEKQHFLNTVYERFFQGYSVKVADTHGIVYTPQEIVDFMCASVEEVLKTEFGKTLGSKDVNILDPCTGTGNFIVNLIRRVAKKDVQRVYAKQLFANEVMLLPYYIAALNIEHSYYEITGAYEAFEGLCFVDTLDLAEKKQQVLGFMTEKNTERVERQKATPITVIIGNPPYNANQVNENDNNKNRAYGLVDGRINRTYASETSATLKNKLYDSYVKFMRWATDRLGDRDGVLCYVTNNSFAVDGPPFDGMRKQLAEEFTSIFHLDLHGNVRQNPKLSGTTHNVFGIQVGVGITLAIRCSSKKQRIVSYFRLPENWRKEEKLDWLRQTKTSSEVPWKKCKPISDGEWVRLESSEEFGGFIHMGEEANEAGIFLKHSTGAKSNRDEIVYDFNCAELNKRAKKFIKAYNAEVDRYKRDHEGEDIDEFVDTTYVKWSSTLKLHLQRKREARFDERCVRRSLYRPYSKRFLYYDEVINDRPGLFRRVNPNEFAERENATICCTNHSQVPFVVIATRLIANEAVGGRAGQCFPFYVYDEDGTNRRENITDWALQHFRDHYNDKKITKWDIFYYVYGILHHPGYRTKFADNLKRELPRIPLAPPLPPSDLSLPPPLPPGEGGRAARPGEGASKSPLPLGEGLGEGIHKQPLPDDLLQFARDLRKTQTDAEKLIWSLLRNRRLAGCKFRRQHSLEPYVLDFYCHEKKLAIELDGGQHNTESGRKSDDKRTRFIEKQGIRVLRYWNHDVLQDTDAVLEAIWNALHTSQDALTPNPSPKGRGEHAPPLPPGEGGRAARPGEGALPPGEGAVSPGEGALKTSSGFWAFAKAGKKLADLHLNYEQLEPWPLKWIETEGEPLSYHVEKMRLSKDKTQLKVNESLTLAKIPPEVFEYRLGNRSALDWVIDQYRVRTDKRSGIESDPNNPDDEEYIVRLVGQVVRVSMETVKIVKGLPTEFAAAD